MTDLERLAEAVKQMTVPCREMDTLIHFLANRKWIGRVPTWPPTKIERPAMERGLTMHIEGDGYFYGDEVPRYTASIDDSTSLFPADCFYRSGHDGAGPDVTAFFCDAIPSAANGLPLQGVRALAGTEALARTAAALKALAAKSREVG